MRRNGFTIIELLIVLTIMAILGSLAAGWRVADAPETKTVDTSVRCK